MNKRFVSLFAIICTTLLALFIRMVSISNSVSTDAIIGNHCDTLEIGASRGKIYDRNLHLLVDRTDRLIAAVTPGTAAIDLLSESIGKKAANEIVSAGKPHLIQIKKEINNDYIRTFPVPVRYDSSQSAIHLVGYLDSACNGVSGIEKAFNNILSQHSGKLSVRFEVDAVGRVLPGLDKFILDENFRSDAGVALTIDSEIQKITEQALNESGIKSGCATVMHIDTGEILAMDSIPRYNPNNISKSLNSPDSPFVNKTLQSYPAGSVFKSLIAAAALEEGISSDTTFECKGTYLLGDTEFSCYNHKIHGRQTMSEALENSCNTYFIELIKHLDSEKIIALCEELGLGKETKLCSGITGESGTLPDKTDLFLPGEKANFSFGQGKLLLSPVQLLAIYNAIATGYYIEPTVFYGYVNSDKLITRHVKNEKARVFSEKTVLKMKEMLSDVVEKGNAGNAKSENISLAGKTGTAQTGIFDKNGKEICRTWFAGFFPAQNPHYIVVVMDEDGVSGNADCAPVFKQICEEMVGFNNK